MTNAATNPIKQVMTEKERVISIFENYMMAAMEDEQDALAKFGKAIKDKESGEVIGELSGKVEKFRGQKETYELVTSILDKEL